MQLSDVASSLRSQFTRLSQRIQSSIAPTPAADPKTERGDARVSLGSSADLSPLYDRSGVSQGDSARMSRQSAAEKVGFLRERVRMLKARIATARGPMLKRLARQLASIAAQLKGVVSQYVGASAKLYGGSAPAAAPAAPAAPAATAAAGGAASAAANAPPSAELAASLASPKPAGTPSFPDNRPAAEP